MSLSSNLLEALLTWKFVHWNHCGQEPKLLGSILPVQSQPQPGYKKAIISLTVWAISCTPKELISKASGEESVRIMKLEGGQGKESSSWIR